MTVEDACTEPVAAVERIGWRPPDWRRSLQLALATVWLLDGVLQLQPFMFTPGHNGFSGMLAGTAAGNPQPIASSIIWNANLVEHHAVLANAFFALIQLALGLGIAWRPTLKLALAGSIVWSLGVWWFGEGLGGILNGAGTPVGGGPGAVLIYAVLAVVLWPVRSAGSAPFAAARAIGAGSAKIVWSALWGLLALLALLGTGRSPSGVRDVITSVDSGEPGWLAAIDRHAASTVGANGLTAAIVLCLVCLAVGAGVYFSPRVTKATLTVAIVVSLVIWVVTENFGMILASGATDPNSGPLLALLALSYWPVVRMAPAEQPSLGTSPELAAAY